MARPHRRLASLGVPAVVGALVLALVVLAGGPAAGWWSSTGLGGSSAGTGSPADLVLTPGTPSAQLYPGGHGDVVLTVENPGDSPVRFDRLELVTSAGTGGFSVDAAHAGCSPTSLTYTTQTNGGAGWTVAARGTSSLVITGAVSMAVGAANACQGAVFTVHLRAAT